MSAVIAADLGGTFVKLSLVIGDQVKEETTFPSNSKGDFTELMSAVATACQQLLSANQLTFSDILGIGFSIPGIVDVVQERVLSINEKHAGAVDFDFRSWAVALGVNHIVMENDARAALIGEWQFGAAKGFSEVNMITLGTGIGGAAMINNQLLYGKHYQAGCLGGHFVVDHQGDRCSCGNVGCVEAVASSWKLPDIIKGHRLFEQSTLQQAEQLDFYHLFEAYRTKDVVAIDLVEQCLSAWSAGVITMIHAYDPEVVVIGGGVMKSQDIILPYIQKQVDQRAWTPCAKVSVRAAALENLAGCLGINYLLKEKIKNVEPTV